MAWIRIVTGAHYSFVFIRINKNEEEKTGAERKRAMPKTLNIEIGNGKCLCVYWYAIFHGAVVSLLSLKRFLPFLHLFYDYLVSFRYTSTFFSSFLFPLFSSLFFLICVYIYLHSLIRWLPFILLLLSLSLNRICIKYNAHRPQGTKVRSFYSIPYYFFAFSVVHVTMWNAFSVCMCIFFSTVKFSARGIFVA